jgi:colanic acid/amylovoran biosynthesis protein
MKKIFIHHFHCLNNYGSGMMGLVSLNELHKRYGKDVIFYCQCNGFTNFEEIYSELNIKPILKNHKAKEFVTSKYKWIRSLQKRKYIVDASEIKKYDEVIILGGDDLSEYYTTKIYRDLIKYWRWSKSTKITLLGQSIGPFYKLRNRMVMKYLYKKYLFLFVIFGANHT